MGSLMKNMYLWCAVLFLTVHNTSSLHDDWAECPSFCRCKWASGKKNADCTNAGLYNVPRNLSSEIQFLDLSKNHIAELSKYEFVNVQMNNLHNLFLRECEILEVNKDAFRGLEILITLDLSKNNIKVLHASTFRDNLRIRNIFLNNNELEKLEDGLFSNLSFLQKVELRDNRIKKIGMRTFINLPILNTLVLEGNNLSFMRMDSLETLPKLASLALSNNPWHCDCRLKSFRDWAIARKLYTPPTSCAEPSALHNQLWSEIDSSAFACKPKIIEPRQGSIFDVVSDNITITCKVEGNPMPDVKWFHNNRIISPHSHGDRFELRTNEAEVYKWVNITITNVRYQDRGEFRCVATNPGGMEERNITMLVSASGGNVGSGGSTVDTLSLVIGLLCGALVLLAIVVILCCCFCRKGTNKRHCKSDTLSPNGDSVIEGSVIPEMEKSLLTAVNPVVKPPRRCEVPSSVTGTEMSELNRTLLDNESVFAGAADDESRSLDFTEPMPKQRSQDTLDMEYRRDHRTYPPDLLSFPPRASQVSPAGSSASTAPDHSRIPPQQGPQSPIHSPIYGTNPNLFRTLPYSRSQSPFTNPVGTPIILPRQGYVTIPRRPRLSWSSIPPVTPTMQTGEVIEPVYDNLGLRTTADGSSVLSLNKVCASPTQQYSPAMRGRPLPATPTLQSNLLPTHYAPMEEQDTSSTPAMLRSVSHFGLPQMRSNAGTPKPSQHPELKVNMEISPDSTSKRNSWSRAIPDGSSIKRTGSEDEMHNSSAPSVGSGTLGRTIKVPPRVPPKPKKKLSTTSSNGTLYEDEGEDGTEV